LTKGEKCSIMGKIKCPECVGCMDYLWIENIRYLYCDFCLQYYAGSAGVISKVENPYLHKIEEAKKILLEKKENSDGT